MNENLVFRAGQDTCFLFSAYAPFFSVHIKHHRVYSRGYSFAIRIAPPLPGPRLFDASWPRRSLSWPADFGTLPANKEKAGGGGPAKLEAGRRRHSPSGRDTGDGSRPHPRRPRRPRLGGPITFSRLALISFSSL